MNLNLKPLNSSGIQESIFDQKISEFFTICELTHNLAVSIYWIEENQFLYCNKYLEKLTNYKAENFMVQGWDFWYSIIVPKELFFVRNSIRKYLTNPYGKNSLSIQYHIKDSQDTKILIKHDIMVYKLKGRILAINYYDASEQEQVERCLDFYGGCRISNFPKIQYEEISSREKEVLHLIANGFSSKQIADKLFISNHTAISHRKHLIQKFNVKNTAQLIKEASKLLDL